MYSLAIHLEIFLKENKLLGGLDTALIWWIMIFVLYQSISCYIDLMVFAKITSDILKKLSLLSFSLFEPKYDEQNYCWYNRPSFVDLFTLKYVILFKKYKYTYGITRGFLPLPGQCTVYCKRDGVISFVTTHCCYSSNTRIGIRIHQFNFSICQVIRHRTTI